MDLEAIASDVNLFTSKIDEEWGIENGPPITVLPRNMAPKLFYEAVLERAIQENGKNLNPLQRLCAKVASHAYFYSKRVSNSNGFHTKVLPNHVFFTPEKNDKDKISRTIAHEVTHARIDHLRRKNPAYEEHEPYFRVLVECEESDLEEPFCQIFEEHLTGKGRYLTNLKKLYTQNFFLKRDVHSLGLDSYNLNAYFMTKAFLEEQTWTGVLDLITNPFDEAFLREHSYEENIQAIKDGTCLRYTPMQALYRPPVATIIH